MTRAQAGSANTDAGWETEDLDRYLLLSLRFSRELLVACWILTQLSMGCAKVDGNGMIGAGAPATASSPLPVVDVLPRSCLSKGRR